MKIQPNPDILDIQPYKGGAGRVNTTDRLVRLASNENALGCSRRAMAAYQACADDLHRYPDGGAVELRQTLAEHHGLNADQIVCGHGSEELITLIVRAYASVGDEVLYSQHGFLMYPLASKAVGATPVSAPEKNLTTDVDALLERVTPKTKLVFVANPNNPTGSVLGRGEIERLHAGLPDDVILVIDAAYAEFMVGEDYTAGADLVEKYHNVVMLRTFSKAYGLAGLRVGWGYFPPEIADVLNRVRGAFNLNAPAQAAAQAAVLDDEFVKMSVQHNTRMLEYTTDLLSGLGVETCPSFGNFMLAHFGDTDRADDVRVKLSERGVFIRQMGVYGLAEYLRITMGQEDEMNILIQNLKEIL